MIYVKFRLGTSPGRLYTARWNLAASTSTLSIVSPSPLTGNRRKRQSMRLPTKIVSSVGDTSSILYSTAWLKGFTSTAPIRTLPPHSPEK
ncbi:MAG: hypothetical protein J6T64_02555 [Bacteroidaceae bacterium]|nr:hypothetical protein [Bacteroidaceae bacterium]